MKIFLSTLLLASMAQGSDKTEQWAKRVIELRAKVELLNEEYKNKKEEAQNEIRSLALQKTELENNIRSEKLRAKQFQDKLKSLRSSLKDESVESQALLPVVNKSLDYLLSYVSSSLPFKKDERIGALKSLRSQIQKKEISAVKASQRLWSLVEDEKRLAKETSLHKQTIELSGTRRLAEVAKVGMLFLYFKTDDEVYGMAKKVNDQWTFIPFRSEEKKKQTLVFMDSLKKQIRQGFFDLPTEI